MISMAGISHHFGIVTTLMCAGKDLCINTRAVYLCLRPGLRGPACLFPAVKSAPTLCANVSLWLHVNNSKGRRSGAVPLLFIVGIGADR